MTLPDAPFATALAVFTEAENHVCCHPTDSNGLMYLPPQEAMDVSADLHELTRCPVGLVSSGVKSILDIGRTLEYLVSCCISYPICFHSHCGHRKRWVFRW
jgi:pseudouridine-5'-phosphate glycosidase